MDMDYSLILAFLVCFFAIVLVSKSKRAPPNLRYPPGPRGMPLVGNVADMPVAHQWETFARWGHEYGDVVYVKVLGTAIVIVNSVDAARDLFEKRSSIYSDRYDFPMMILMGWSWNMALMKYGERWRRHRKTFLRAFNLTTIKDHYPIQSKWTRNLLVGLLDSPEDFITHVRHHSGAIIMEVLYGIEVLPKGDPYIETAEEAMAGLAEAANPGAFLIDVLPILKYVPEWFPGAGFQTKARLWRVPTTDMAERPFRVVKEALDAGTAKPSVTASLLEGLSQKNVHSKDQEEVIRNSGAIAYAAGSDTTAVALSWFIMAMVLYPEAQRKAQEELDSVIGMDRLPNFEDRKQLPYTVALCKEVQRWNPVVPLGIPHATSKDDVYGDYFIPGGSIVMGNAWAMLREEKTFGPRPESFEPERFLDPGRCDPNIAFGHGRRICPGRHFAIDTVFIAVASILKMFNIAHAKDNQGKNIPVKPLCTLGAITRPEDFQCSITPRSEAAKNLLRSSD